MAPIEVHRKLMFTEGEKPKPGEGTPPSAPEATVPEVPPVDPPQDPPQDPPADPTPGPADQSVEIQNLQEKVNTLSTLTEKQTTQLEQAGFNIEKYKNLLKEANIDIEEPGGLSEEKIKEIVSETNKPLMDEVQKMTKTMSEVMRGVIKPKALPGNPGQTPPPQPKEPVLPLEVQGTISRLGLKWTGKGLVYKSPKTGRVYDMEDTSDIS